jgi:hypothetical protein
MVFNIFKINRSAVNEAILGSCIIITTQSTKRKLQTGRIV